MALIFALSSIAVNVPSVRHFPMRDKGIHFVEYAVLGWLCAAAASRTWLTRPWWRTAVFALFVTVLWGLSDEIHQAFVPGRSAEVADLIADTIGATFGIAMQRVVSNRTVS
ncbi:MAG: VanZ family protein [Polyangiales bacterium]